MKRSIFILLFAILLPILFTACEGDLEVTDIEITAGLKMQYTVGDKPDFSAVTATVHYNDGNHTNVSASELLFGSLDTSSAGSKILEISYQGFTKSVKITVTDAAYGGSSGEDILGIFLPDTLVLWEEYRNSFKISDCAYAVGDDNPFRFEPKIALFSNGEYKETTNYSSISEVYIEGCDTPLSGDELARYVLIDSENKTFDFTEDAIGMSFTITTRPESISQNSTSSLSKSFDITVVDGYNIYEAYELNYLTNKSVGGFDFSDVDYSETRSQKEIVDDFLLSEKGVTAPRGFSSLVIHNNLVIEPTDIPHEYFYNKDRSSYLYDLLSIFDHATAEDNNLLTIHGNYFAIASYKLPSVVPEGVGNQNNTFSDTSLFRFHCDAQKNKNFDHKLYSVNIKNLMLIDDNPQSDKEENSKDAILGLIAMKTRAQIINIDNTRIQSFGFAILAESDYQTINLSECIFQSAWQNHIYLKTHNTIQAANDEPLPKAQYPRLTLNISATTMQGSGGPAIITQVQDPDFRCNKHSGSEINISGDSVIESWITGDEAWFKAWRITFLAPIIRSFDKCLLPYDSSFITERPVTVNGTTTTMKYMNIIAITLMIPSSGSSVGDVYDQIIGSVDIDGRITVGGKTMLDMDDYIIDGKESNFGNITISNIKSTDKTNHVLHSSGGGIGYTSAGGGFKVAEGDISAKSETDYIALYFYSLGLLFANYHY